MIMNNIPALDSGLGGVGVGGVGVGGVGVGGCAIFRVLLSDFLAPRP